ncbi:MAG: ribulose-phosphate 3-epimerase [Clostridiales bacterium]|jgi:ribulose-phosphate 3-epimerase|nr:ribulose-phosphate 3-epimerase [Clostridiales bacterium]
MAQIAPSILSADFSCLREQIKRVEETGINYLHLDIMDGHFVPNITFGPPVIKKLKSHTGLIFDVHLMIEKPERYIDDFIAAGADILTVHSEACVHLHRTMQSIKDQGIKVGVALNPATPIVNILHVLDLADLVLIMSVNPGFGGQKFISSSLDKINELAEIKEKHKFNFIIEVDGGINPNTISKVASAGAELLVAGSAVFKENQIEENIATLQKSILGLI